MFDSDAVAYIPLLLTAVVAAVICVFLAVIKRRNTAKVSFISFLALLVLIGACVYTALHPGMTRFLLLLLLAEVLLIPYCVMLAFGKPKEKQVKITEEQHEEKPAVIVEDVQPHEINLIEQGRAFVIQASDSFSDSEGMQKLLDLINKTCIEVTGADGGAVLMVDDFDDAITVKSFMGNFPPPYKLPQDLPHKPLRVSTSFKFAQFPLRDNIFGEIASSGKPELITNFSDDERIFQNGPEDFLKLGSFIFMPVRLRGKGIVIALIALSKDFGHDSFTYQEYNRALTLEGFAESALKTVISFQEYTEKQELTKETDIASDIQKRFIPKKIPAFQGISLGAFSTQAGEVCSDTYDIIQSRSDRISFILMDVAGKGMNSLLVMTMIRAMCRLVVNTTQSAGTIISWANRGICGETNFDHFASIALINYNPQTKRIQIAAGGTTPVFMYSAAKNTVERKSLTCDPVGVEKTTTYKDIEFTVAQGDIIITYSDGVIEALNREGKQYSSETLCNLIKANNNLSGKELANLIQNDIKKFIGSEKPHDDQTLLVFKIQ